MADITKRDSERGTIQPRRGRGLESLWDWEPFRSFLPSNLMSGNLGSMFGIDVTRTEDGYDVEMPVPGFRPEDIDLTYQDGVIAVTGRNDRRSFTRTLSVPDDVDEEQIDAHVEHGILTIHLKQTPQRQPRRISIRGTTQQPASAGTTSPSSTTQTSK